MTRRTIFGSHGSEELRAMGMKIYLINQLIDHLVCIIKEGIYHTVFPELSHMCVPNYVVLDLTDYIYISRYILSYSVHRENELTRKRAAISNLLSIHSSCTASVTMDTKILADIYYPIVRE